MENRWIRPLLPALLLFACKPAQPAAPAATLLAGGVAVKEMSVTARGFEPSRVEATPGQPVVLRITR